MNEKLSADKGVAGDTLNVQSLLEALKPVMKEMIEEGLKGKVQEPQETTAIQATNTCPDTHNKTNRLHETYEETQERLKPLLTYGSHETPAACPEIYPPLKIIQASLHTLTSPLLASIQPNDLFHDRYTGERVNFEAREEYRHLVTCLGLFARYTTTLATTYPELGEDPRFQDYVQGLGIIFRNTLERRITRHRLKVDHSIEAANYVAHEYSENLERYPEEVRRSLVTFKKKDHERNIWGKNYGKGKGAWQGKNGGGGSTKNIEKGSGVKPGPRND